MPQSIPTTPAAPHAPGASGAALAAPAWAFAPYVVVSAVHVIALFAGADEVSTPTKALLMPALAFAVAWVAFRRPSPATTGYRPIVLGLLFAAIGLSWLGDEAGLFFPFAPTLPLMLLFFGLAHLCYIALFWRHLAIRHLPVWAVVYAVWWGALLAVLWTHVGELLVAVAIYGLVLGATAVAASRCHPLVVWGGVFFLASDTILAFRLFLPEAMPGWTSGMVMLTYCVGQGMLAAGVLASARARRPAGATASGEQKVPS